ACCKSQAGSQEAEREGRCENAQARCKETGREEAGQEIHSREVAQEETCSEEASQEEAGRASAEVARRGCGFSRGGTARDGHGRGHPSPPCPPLEGEGSLLLPPPPPPPLRAALLFPAP